MVYAKQGIKLNKAYLKINLYKRKSILCNRTVPHAMINRHGRFNKQASKNQIPHVGKIHVIDRAVKHMRISYGESDAKKSK